MVDYVSKYYIDTKEIYNAFILGDFNVEDTKSLTYKAATSSIFKIPDAILTSEVPLFTNKGQNKIYDQILYYTKYNNIAFSKAGAFNYYDTVFNNLAGYKARAEQHTGKKMTQKTFEDFITYQMSDHLPLWVEMKTDLAESYLNAIKKK